MRKFRQGSLALRLAVGVIALYALLLQAFLAPPITAFASGGDVICVADTTGPGSAGSEHKHHHGLCCIVACATCCAAYVASVAGLIEFPIRAASQTGFDDTGLITARAPLEFYFAARGPPQNI
jgi:hypothetical protein